MDNRRQGFDCRSFQGDHLFNPFCSFIANQQPYPNTLDQQYNLTVVTPAAVQPVTLSELADQMNLDDGGYSEALVTAYGFAGREWLEATTKSVLISTTYDCSFDVMDNCGIRLPRRPVTSVASVKYLDQSGTLQTLDPSKYDVDTKSIWTVIRPKPNSAFPITSFSPNAVTIRFTAGSASDATGVSPLAKLAITSWAAHQYENREAATDTKMQPLPFALESIVWLLDAPGV